jgi:hypothetical protein
MFSLLLGSYVSDSTLLTIGEAPKQSSVAFQQDAGSLATVQQFLKKLSVSVSNLYWGSLFNFADWTKKIMRL